MAMMNFTPTICPYCGVGCGMILAEQDGKLCDTYPLVTHPVSQGKLCIKGWNAHEFVHSEKRLRQPYVRKNGKLQEASWEEAIEVTARNLARIKETAGPDTLAFLSCARATNEENFLFMKLVRSLIGTNNVDHCARV
jgi:predicted molibdopterin-dependent oxidoreductase YjgC